MRRAAGVEGEGRGKVSGRIVSVTAEPLSGVVVTLSVGNGASSMFRVTDGQGQFGFQDVPPGTYRLRASLPRYDEAILDQVRVDGDRETRIELPLSLPQFFERVEIRAASPTEAGDEPVPPERLEVEQLDLLPLATDSFHDAFPLLPGVVRDPEGKLSFNGSRPSQSILLVNGTNVTDPVTGDFAIELRDRNFDRDAGERSIREVVVVGNGARVWEEESEVGKRGGYVAMWAPEARWTSKHTRIGGSTGVVVS